MLVYVFVLKLTATLYLVFTYMGHEALHVFARYEMHSCTDYKQLHLAVGIT